MIKRKIMPIVISGILLLTGCSNIKIEDNDKVINKQLVYSNLIDGKTQDKIKKILIENKIDKKQADYFIELVKDYNEKSDIKSLNTSKDGFETISKQQVPYDEVYLGDVWDYDKLNYMDFNCRLTAFTLFKDFVKSKSEFKGDDTNLIFDIDSIENNPISKFSKEDIKKFINLYSDIKVENTQDIEKLSQSIIKEWENRKISFVDNPTVSMINVFLHAPEDSNVFVGHAGVLVKADDGLLFIEKYGPSLPYQVSKFKDKKELKEYLMDRLDTNTADNGAAKPIIMENSNLMK